MSKTCKSPRKVLVTAWTVAKSALPEFSHKYSPKKFTQHQLFACLVLKEFLQLDYRKLAAVLKDANELAKAIGLQKVPHYTTFQKAAARLLLSRPANQLLDETIRSGIASKTMRRRVDLAALDGTGLETRHASDYYVKRRAKSGKHWQKTTYTRFPKAGILCDCSSHMILAVIPARGPGPDIKHFRQALDQALTRVSLGTLTADAGYDSEKSHEYAREECGVRLLIPPLIGRPTDKLPKGYWRKQMAIRLHNTRYGQRWQVEVYQADCTSSAGLYQLAA